MFVPARNNRGSDVHRAKSTIIDILKSVYRAMDDDESELLADKSKRGFANDKTGEMLCPVDLDWQKDKCVVNPAVSSDHGYEFSIQSAQKTPKGEDQTKRERIYEGPVQRLRM